MFMLCLYIYIKFFCLVLFLTVSFYIAYLGFELFIFCLSF